MMARATSFEDLKKSTAQTRTQRFAGSGNHASRNISSGARAQERAAAPTLQRTAHVTRYEPALNRSSHAGETAGSRCR